MTSQEILETITEGTMNEGFEKLSLNRENREDFAYDPSDVFTHPLIIRGTNKQLTLYPHLRSFEENRECFVHELSSMCKKVDENLRLDTVEDISNLSIISINDNYILLEDVTYGNDQESKQYYVLPTYNDNDNMEGVGFRKFSEILKIPYAYSKKSPGFLNEVNFNYWKKALTVAQDSKMPIDIVYMKEPIAVTLTSNSENECNEEILAYLVVNIFKTPVTKEKGEIVEIGYSTINEKVPMISNILDNVEQQLNNIREDVKLSVQQYSLGYSGTNKGRHYARLVLENRDYEVDIDGDTLLPSVVIDTDFIGKSDNFGEVIITFSLFREICSNGLTVVWNEKQKEEIREKFVTKYCSNRGISVEDANYLEVHNEAVSKFNVVFSSKGIHLPINVANSTFASSLFKQVFEYFLESLSCIGNTIEELSKMSFDEVKEEDFVNTVHNVGKDMKINSDILKYLIIEYIVGTFQDQNFKTPLDVINFITYICRAYDSSVQLDVERKAYTFAYTLAQILIHKVKKDNSVYETYNRKVNRSVLG